MLFTVFQYLPVLEEEAQGNTTELAKKSTEDDCSGDDNDETDSDSDDALNNHFNYNIANNYSKSHSYPFKNEHYNSFFQKINIPPPKA